MALLEPGHLKVVPALPGPGSGGMGARVGRVLQWLLGGSGDYTTLYYSIA